MSSPEEYRRSAWQRRTGVVPSSACGWSSRHLAPPSSSFSVIQVYDTAYIAGLVDIAHDDPSWSVTSKSKTWTASAVDDLNRANSVTVLLRRRGVPSAPSSVLPQEAVDIWFVCNATDVSKTSRIFPQGTATLQIAAGGAFDSASCSCSTSIDEHNKLGVKCTVAFTNLKVDKDDVVVPLLVRVAFSEIRMDASRLIDAMR